MRIRSRPTCGSRGIRNVRRDLEGEFQRQTLQRSGVRFLRVPGFCGEQVFDQEAMRQIESVSPGLCTISSAENGLRSVGRFCLRLHPNYATLILNAQGENHRPRLLRTARGYSPMATSKRWSRPTTSGCRAHRHSRATHRRRRTSRLRHGHRRRQRRLAQRGIEATESTPSSSAPSRPTCCFPPPRAWCRTISARATPGDSISSPPAPDSSTAYHAAPAWWRPEPTRRSW